MHSPLAKVMERSIFRTSSPRKRKVEVKPSDIPTFHYTASSCHDEIDRRTHLVDAEYAKECALEGMARTQVIWLKEGKVKA